MHFIVVGMMAVVVFAAPQECPEKEGREESPHPHRADEKVQVHFVERLPDTRTELQAVMPPIPPPEQPIQKLVQSLESPDATVRTDAATQLRGASAISEDVVAELWRLQRDDPEEGVRLAAALAVGTLEARGVIGKRQLDEKPTPTATARPTYPPEAFRQGITGSVLALILIDERGEVRHVEMLQSIPTFDQAAISVLLKWRFSPAVVNGRAVPYATATPVSFKIY